MNTPSTGGTPALLTTREVAELLRVSTRTVLRLIAAGELGSVQVSAGCVRVTEDSVSDLIAERGTPRERVVRGTRARRFA